MRLRNVVMTLMATCIHLADAESADAPPCESGLHYTEWTQKYFKSAKAVFLATVVDQEVVYVQQPGTPPPVSDPQQTSSMDALLKQIEAGQARPRAIATSKLATIEVHKVWKGTLSGQSRVRADLARSDMAIHQILSVGETYLVFAFEDDDGIMRIPLQCASNESDNETKSKMRVLDALTRMPGQQ